MLVGLYVYFYRRNIDRASIVLKKQTTARRILKSGMAYQFAKADLNTAVSIN